MSRYPFLLSIPHGGIDIPSEVLPYFALDEGDILHYSDPHTRDLYNFGLRVAATLATPISRMVVDLNRPPITTLPDDPDGVIKIKTVDGRDVYLPGSLPDIRFMHQLSMKYYFPYHAELDRLLDSGVRIGFDCHSMLPFGPPEAHDRGKKRPLICLGNNGDSTGRPGQNALSTCPVEWITSLADSFREEFSSPGEVTMNNPFSGGFIINAHYWRKGIPWIQIEVNRSLYEENNTLSELKCQIWAAISRFWDKIR